MLIPDSQWYRLNLFNNVEDIMVFLGLKLLLIFFMNSCSRNAQVSLVEEP